MSKRAFALKLWDLVRLRLLTTRLFFDKPQVKYQPLPFVGIHTAKRAAGSESRLSAITTFLDRHSIDGGSSVDYGCNVGYFSLSLCHRGFLAYGIEEDDRALATAYTASRLMGSSLFCPIQQRVGLHNIDLMPHSDVSLTLSIWHHWVRHMGLDDATKLLQAIFAKTHRVLFFDTGENEMPSCYNLPFGDQEPRLYLEQYLAQSLGGHVEWLGQHKAFAPKEYEKDQVVLRHLFAVIK